MNAPPASMPPMESPFHTYRQLVSELDHATGNLRGKPLPSAIERNWRRLLDEEDGRFLKESTLREIHTALIRAAEERKHPIPGSCPTADALVKASLAAKRRGKSPASPAMLTADTMPDLPQGVPPTSIASKHLSAYLLDLKAKSNRHLGTGHIKERRSVLEATATTLEALREWRGAALALAELAELDMKVEDYTGAARARLRQGIAHYRDGEYPRSCTVLTHAHELLETRVPRHGELRTHIKVWDYLGLAHLRSGDPTEALQWLRRAESLPEDKQLRTPLALASRYVRRGIAHMHLGDLDAAHENLMQGLTLRVKLQARAELARGLRYLGVLHFVKGNWAAALCIWDACEGHQDYVNDDPAEKAKLLYYRAEIFRRWASPDGDDMGEELPVPVLSTLLSPQEEQAVHPLERWCAKTPYLRSQARTLAEACLRAALEIVEDNPANRRRLALIQKRAHQGLRALHSPPRKGRPPHPPHEAVMMS